MAKELKKIFLRRAAWFVMRGFTILNASLPLAWSYFLGRMMGNLVYTVLGNHRKIAMESLEIAFPEKSSSERKKIARGFFVFMVQSALELLYYLRNLDKLGNITFEGREHLDKALENKKGAIIVSAHLGNFPLMSLKLAKEGYGTNFVTRPMRDEKAGDYLLNLRTSAGVKDIPSAPRKECVNGILNALSANELVILMTDLNYGTGGVWTKFFGKLAATPIGPVTFGLRTGAAIVPGFIYRTGQGRHCIRFLPQQELTVTPNKDETILLNVIKLTRIIEAWISEFPEQWGWIHRRWKSQPPQDIKPEDFKIET